MPAIGAKPQIKLRNILCLTDFSEPSEAALPFAVSIARKHGARVRALHVVIPDAYVYAKATSVGWAKQAEEAKAKAKTKTEMQRVESQLAGVPYETSLEWGVGVWTAVEWSIQQNPIDLIVVGTHGRTGAQKFVLGSVAEEIFRRSSVPVLTIGPSVHSGKHNGASFHCVLFPTDFSPESLAAARHAFSLAQESQARVVLMNVMRKPEGRDKKGMRLFEVSVAEAIQRLYDVAQQFPKLQPSPEVFVDYGEPADRIVEAAKRCGADLIVVGVRDATCRLGAATQLERATAQKSGRACAASRPHRARLRHELRTQTAMTSSPPSGPETADSGQSVFSFRGE
jgi:nucleotide-binding universal stress UspA family protein